MLKFNLRRLAAGFCAFAVFAFFAASFGINKADAAQMSDDWPPPLYAHYNYNAFEKFYFYEADKLERYEAFHKTNPGLSADDVVWMVNSSLDKPFYSDVNEITDFSVFPLLVNKYNRLPDDYVPENLTKLPSGRLATVDTKEAFTALADDARSQGYYIKDVSSYRSFSYQRSLYNRYLSRDYRERVDTYSARAGYSEHQTGRAIDVCGSNGVMNLFGFTKEAGWVEENAWQYGFIIRYPKNAENITGYTHEPWHITYVGVETAAAMRDFGIATLEEYTVKFIKHTPLNQEAYTFETNWR